MPDQYSLRPARIEDLAAINELAEVMDSLHREHLPNRFRKPEGPNRSREYVESLIRDENTFLHVAESAGDVVGLINAGLDTTPDIPIKRPRRFLRIRGVVVRPDRRRQGVATALFRAACDWAALHGAVEVQLSVYDFNAAAAAFWQAHGFSCLSHRLFRPLP
ncbi:GNAT family N-acetyltransferase [candidate division WOR-3 bacterium]|nr:GNAT family N-acetyltransferase [candidate division WOR-3 bacterium]